MSDGRHFGLQRRASPSHLFHLVVDLPCCLKMVVSDILSRLQYGVDISSLDGHEGQPD